MGFLHGAEFDPYIGLTKNGELSSCYSTVIWLIRIDRSPLDAVPLGNVYGDDAD